MQTLIQHQRPPTPSALSFEKDTKPHLISSCFLLHAHAIDKRSGAVSSFLLRQRENSRYSAPAAFASSRCLYVSPAFSRGPFASASCLGINAGWSGSLLRSSLSGLSFASLS